MSLSYVRDGHGGNVKLRRPSDHQVSILEVVGSAATREEIIQLENLWMQKLQSRDMGLNKSGSVALHDLEPSALAGKLLRRRASFKREDARTNARNLKPRLCSGLLFVRRSGAASTLAYDLVHAAQQRGRKPWATRPRQPARSAPGASQARLASCVPRNSQHPA